MVPSGQVCFCPPSVPMSGQPLFGVSHILSWKLYGDTVFQQPLPQECAHDPSLGQPNSSSLE